MLFSLLSDAKNFAVGSVSGSLSRAGRWGTWAFGFRGESYETEQFSQFHIGGLLGPAIIGGLLAAPFLGLAAPAAALGAYAAGVVGTALLGAVTGFIAGGFHEVREGVAARREWKDQLAQEQSQAKLQGLQTKLDKAQSKVSSIHDKMNATKDKMHARAERGGHVERLMQSRESAPSHGKGK